MPPILYERLTKKAHTAFDAYFHPHLIIRRVAKFLIKSVQVKQVSPTSHYRRGTDEITAKKELTKINISLCNEILVRLLNPVSDWRRSGVFPHYFNSRVHEAECRVRSEKLDFTFQIPRQHHVILMEQANKLSGSERETAIPIRGNAEMSLILVDLHLGIRK